MTYKYPIQRWLLATILINRGIDTPELAKTYIDPEADTLPSPLGEFPDLEKSVNLLVKAIARGDKIAICGDYDADGMTSTSLLLRALRHLGARVNHAIPSRMKEGYGINQRIVEEFAESGVGLILTVDNGISAHEPIALAIELGLKVIITDHHDLPPILPNASAILNPKLLTPNSPYQGLAGVGVAYILAVTTAQKMGKLQGLTESLLALFTLGTIADLAPLIGVNRRWLKRGLRKLPKSQLVGIQSLMQIAGISEEQKQLQPDDIGFKLGPRINAIGRIGDPQIVIELLTTDDAGKIRGSARGIEEFHVFEALQFCQDLLGKFGGHKMAGGFSLPTANLLAFKQRLSQFSHKILQIEQLKPLIKVDTILDFKQINLQLFQQIDSLQPWGIGNELPVFWTPNVRIVEQKTIGKNHLKLLLAQRDDTRIQALAWRWGEYCPLPTRLDIAYKLKENTWNGNTTIEIELVGVRLPQENDNIKKAIFMHADKMYQCSFWGDVNEIRIKNEQGDILVVQKGQRIGLLGKNRQQAREVNVTEPRFYTLIKVAIKALAI